MSVHNPAESSRKLSLSSTHSGTHSPTNSPNTSQRKSSTGPAGNMFGVGIGNPTSLNGLNSGWQVWGSSTPTAVSASSASSATELSSPQCDPNYRGGLVEGWTKPTNGNWENPAGSPQRKEFSQMDSHTPLMLRQWHATAGPMPAFPVPRVDDRPTGSKPGQFSPQGYDNAIAVDASVRYLPGSPTGSVTFGSQPSGLPAHPGGYESLQPPSFVDNELSLAFRGMSVEDEHGDGRHQGAFQHVPNRSFNSQSGQPAMVQQPRAPYHVYPPADFAPYYSNSSPREPYQYGFDAHNCPPEPPLYTSPGAIGSSVPTNMYAGMSPHVLHPSPIDVHRPGIFYDYGAAARSSQFYYANHQAMMYPPSPPSPVSPQLALVPYGDKKHDVPYNNNTQQQLVLYSPMRSPPSPYGVPLPLMMPGMYGPGLNLHAMYMYQPGLRAIGYEGTELSATLRSQLLEEFRADKIKPDKTTRKWELREVFGYVVEFSGDQHGSRFIQQKLETANSEEKQIVFDEIVPHSALQLIQDVFGNYVIQKLFEHGTQVQKTILARVMEGHLLSLSLQMYGCRVVQKAVEYILPDQQDAFVKELEPHVLKCVKDANGNHVIQKLVERVAPDRLTFVASFRRNAYELSTHPYGCRVLQRCLEHLPEEYMRPLMDEVHRFSANLMQDQFGNYVMQFVLEHGSSRDRALIISKLRGQMLHMARHKFASNVCEKALILADPESRRILINEIITPRPDGVSPVVAMMRDQYANYVLQRALAVVEDDQRESLVSRIRPQLANMRRHSNSYSKHLASIERLIEQSPAGQPLDLTSNIV